MAALDLGLEPVNPPDDALDALSFRTLAGMFCTGVTVVTTNADGIPQGMTASAFSSVSLDPLLILLCVSRGSRTAEAIVGHGAFAVHVLAEHQQQLSHRFSRPGDNHFVDLDLEWNDRAVPLLTDFLARLECTVHDVLDGGDHRIVLGRVMRGRAGHRPDPLLFYRGRYGRHAAKIA